MQNLHIRTTCRICDNPDLIPFANLGSTPLADKFCNSPIEKEQLFPLEIKVCPKCFLVQMTTEVDQKLLFGDDYAFYTSASPSSIKYFEDYHKWVIEKYPEQAKGFVLEIASNDGLLINMFKEEAKTILGIDPARNVAELALKNGIPTMIDYFGSKCGQGVSKSFGKADLIIANNVVAHVDDLNDFIKGVKETLSPNGVFILEVQYLANLLFNCQFDNLYHEHRSFFSLYPLQVLFKNHELKIIDVLKTNTQGGSLRISVVHKDNPIEEHFSVKGLEAYEELVKINEINTYLGFQSRINHLRETLLDLLADLKAQGKTIAGYGASAKSCTMLNYTEAFEYLDYISDVTPYKLGKYAPGSKLLVKKDKEKPDYYLLLVWNYVEGVLQREIEFLKNGGKFIIPISTGYPMIIG